MAQTYTFDKSEVIDTLKTNREQHEKIFLEALEGYRKTAIATFEENIKKVKKGKFISYFNLQLPTNQKKDYDRVIALLERSKGDEVELTEEQFTNYMLDDWSWKRQFYASNSMYSSTAAANVDEDDD